MTEVKLTCLCNQLHLADLGLTLVKGDVVFLSSDKVSKSKDLLVAERAQGVRRESVKRYASVTPKSANTGKKSIHVPSLVDSKELSPLMEVKSILEDFKMQALDEIKQALTDKPKKKPAKN